VLLVFTSSASAGNGTTSAPGQTAPINAGVPTISGQPFVGMTLTANAGNWNGPPATYTFQWLHCSSAGDACTPLGGAAAQTDVLRSSDMGFTMRVAVTASNKNGTSIATSQPTASVSAPPPVTSNTTTTTPTTSTIATTTTTTTTTTTAPPPTTTTTPSTTTTTPSSPTGTVLFNGDFDTCDLAQWSDLHDAQLGINPPGFIVKTAPSFGTCAAQVNVTGAAGSSTSGDASFLWDGGNYNLPWLSKGADTWFRMQVAFPDGTNPAFPGKFVHSVMSSGWDTFLEWHSAPNAGYSTMVGVWGSDPPHLQLRPVGGAASNQTFAYIRDPNNLQYNHWYDILVHQVFSDDPNVGYIEWWVDGVQKYAAHFPTLTRRADGSVPAVSLQAGLYRGPSRTDIGTIYIDGVRAGTTRAAVGG
jgi:Polysaccharide lyase